MSLNFAIAPSCRRNGWWEFSEPVPPEPNGFVADIDTALEQQIFNLPQCQPVADVHHHREADHLGRAVETTDGMLHHQTLRDVPIRLKPIYSDSALGHAAMTDHSGDRPWLGHWGKG
ncbi:MAG: hypothetical protein OEU25_11280 [Rhodospirillales bacterium]|nr:hypothetical protein [Rhodospirillales bacterium]MDH3969590.1 hypothetical protein [Rhodospirillales bacterium]